MLKPSANDHVFNRSGNKLFQKPFVAFLVNEAFGKMLRLMGKFDPGICFEDLPHVLKLVVSGDLIEFVELALQHLLVEGRFLQFSQYIGRIPDRDERNILH